jgi:hypothetical protein
MHHNIINALAEPSINPYYVIQNREFLLHLSLKDLFVGFSPFRLIITGATLKMHLLLFVRTML